MVLHLAQQLIEHLGVLSLDTEAWNGFIRVGCYFYRVADVPTDPKSLDIHRRTALDMHYVNYLSDNAIAARISVLFLFHGLST